MIFIEKSPALSFHKSEFFWLTYYILYDLTHEKESAGSTCARRFFPVEAITERGKIFSDKAGAMCAWKSSLRRQGQSPSAVKKIPDGAGGNPGARGNLHNGAGVGVITECWRFLQNHNNQHSLFVYIFFGDDFE